MSNKLPWMPLDIPAYRNDTGHLTTLQHGGYVLLLMHYWCQGPLPDDDAQLAAIARMDAKTWRANQTVIRQFFSKHNGELHQKRADLERERAADISAKRRGAANIRHHHSPNGHANGDANAPPNASPEPVDKYANAPPDAVPKHANAPANAPPNAGANGPYTVPSTERKKEVREESVLINNNPLSPKLRASAEPPKSDAELGEDGIEKPPHVIDILKAREAWTHELDHAGAEGAQVRAVAKALAANNRPYGEVRSADAQLDALRRQPAAVGADAAMGLKWQPAEPVRDLEAQRQAILAEVSPEQLAKAHAAFAARAAPRTIAILEAPRVSRH